MRRLKATLVRLDQWQQYYLPLMALWAVITFSIAIGCFVAALVAAPAFVFGIGALAFMAGVVHLWLCVRYADSLWWWMHDRKILSGQAADVPVEWADLRPVGWETR